MLLRHAHGAIEGFVGTVARFQGGRWAQLGIGAGHAALGSGDLLAGAAKDTNFPLIAHQVAATWAAMLELRMAIRAIDPVLLGGDATAWTRYGLLNFAQQCLFFQRT